MFSSLTEDYIAYLEAKKYFKTLPKWKLELWGYENNKQKITLPSVDTTNAIANLPPPNKGKHKRFRSQ